jgi:hypothetical protein
MQILTQSEILTLFLNTFRFKRKKGCLQSPPPDNNSEKVAGNFQDILKDVKVDYIEWRE